MDVTAGGPVVSPRERERERVQIQGAPEKFRYVPPNRQTLSTPKTKVGGHKDTYTAIVAVIKRTLYRATNMHNKTAK